MKKVILKIEGMSCSGCSNGLEKYLNKQEDIESASVNLVMETATITCKNTTSIKQLGKYVEQAGFKSLGEEKIFNEIIKVSPIPLIVFGCLSLFIMYLTMSEMLKLPVIINSNNNPILYVLVLFILTIPFIVYSLNILKSGFKNLMHLMPNMDTLVSFGIISSYLYSIYSMIMVIIGNKEYIDRIYFETTVFLIFFIKLGKFILDKTKNKTKNDIKQLVKMTPSKAHLKTEDGYRDITIDEIKEDDILICLPGEKVAVDGEIIEGTSTFDESLLTGESLPARKGPKSNIIAGSINYEGKVEYLAKKIGKKSTISEIVRLVVEAANTKGKIAKIVDKICGIFVPAIIIIAVLTFLINLIILHDFSTSITRFITVLVVACPCSLGLATPLALVVSVSNSVRKGILIKDSETLEIASKVDTVIFDKTGTLTYGVPTISQINNHSSLEDKELLNLIVSIEKFSNHPLAKGIKNYAKKNKIKGNLEFTIEDLPGFGVKAKDDKDIYYVCNSRLLKKLDIINQYALEEEKMTTEGMSIIYLVKNKKIISTIGLIDKLRSESKKIIKELTNNNIDVLILSGDNEVTTSKIVNELEISKEKVYSGLSPKEKNKIIKDLVDNNHIVMMVGDGINDAPALKASSIGVSLNSGTDIATNSANIVLTNNNLMRIMDILSISKKTIKNIKQNIFWAVIYNVLMITIASGLIEKIHISPTIACIAMILSSLTVTLNALRLKIKI